MLKIFTQWMLVLLTTLGAAGCATLPDTDALIAHHSAQEANFETARGPVSARQNAAILASLQRKSGDLDILEKQMALEQAISDSPLVLGNKVSLLQDGAATYAAMFGAIRQAKDHINLETYIIEDDDTGRLFADIGQPPLDPATDRAMICGSPAMLKDLKLMLEARQFKEGNTSHPGDFVVERAFVEQ